MNIHSQSSTGSSKGWDKDKTKKFVMEAANGGMMEVHLGQIAAQKASSPQVKDFGNLMVKDHSDANQKLKSAVSGLQVTIPSTMDKDHMDKMDKLTNKTGKDFDKAYVDMMVQDHRKDVAEFEDAAKNVTDPSVKSWVTATLPVLKQHLTKIENIQKTMK